MSQQDLQLWIEIYAAMGLICGLAAILSAIRVAWLYRTDTSLRPSSVRDWVLAAPLAWWRWQKTYLTTAPVTLGIILLFGWTLPWSQTQATRQSTAKTVADLPTSPTRN